MEKQPIPKVMRLARVPDGENPIQASSRTTLEPGTFGPMRGVWVTVDGLPRFYPESVIDRIDCAWPADEGEKPAKAAKR